jgi:hypothetical protein
MGTACARGENGHTIALMSNDIEPAGDRDAWRRRRGNRTPIESIVVGAAIFLGCGAAYFFMGHTWWLLFPAIFAGLLPMVKGVTRLLSDRSSAPRDKRAVAAEKAAESERAVLRIAQARGGIVTPSQVALDSKLSIEEAGALLESLASRGHAAMEVREDGRIVYRFSEFLEEKEPARRLE